MTMSRISSTFAALSAQGRKGLIPFITAGDPEPGLTVALMHALVEGGADVIELGVPFSDPMADGPVIQRASERALANGVTLARVLEWVREFRQRDASTPVVLMGYANPIERMGLQAFADACAEAGVDGAIVVDYPPEESVEFSDAMRARGLDAIFLLAPTSTDARIAMVAERASGYVYYVSLKGVTGAGNLDVVQVLAQVERIKRTVRLPVGVGFGIRDGATARAIAAGADAVVIGTRLIQELDSVAVADAPARAQAFVAGIRGALDAPPSRNTTE